MTCILMWCKAVMCSNVNNSCLPSAWPEGERQRSMAAAALAGLWGISEQEHPLQNQESQAGPGCARRQSCAWAKSMCLLHLSYQLPCRKKRLLEYKLEYTQCAPFHSLATVAGAHLLALEKNNYTRTDVVG